MIENGAGIIVRNMREDYTQDPGVALMQRVQAGDRTAFEELVVLHRKAVVNSIYRYTGNPSVAEGRARSWPWWRRHSR